MTGSYDNRLEPTGPGEEAKERKRVEGALREQEKLLSADLAALTRMHELSAKVVGPGGLPALLQEIMDAAVFITGACKGTLQLLEGSSLCLWSSKG